jgi:hypothetical protein
MDLPEAPHNHPSHTGHRWLDISLGLCAMFVSVVSLVVAVEHGRTMQRMADANARMVDENAWPFVEFSDHNADEQGNADIRLVLTNEGIGPARIETFELWLDGKPMSWGGSAAASLLHDNTGRRATGAYIEHIQWRCRAADLARRRARGYFRVGQGSGKLRCLVEIEY